MTDKKSTHKVEVVPVNLEPHPDADSLSIVKIWGYTVVVRTEDWAGVDKGAYIVPDSVVSDHPCFDFLGTKKRVRVCRLRGVLSQGLLVPAPDGSNIGDDVAEILGVTRYEPPLQMIIGGDVVSPPEGYHPKYDLEAFERYCDVFIEGEPVYVTEKIHGANARYACVSGVQYCGSRTQWKKESETDPWWMIFHKYPGIGEFCKQYPHYTLYGEIYGKVQSLRYGLENDIAFAAFDICRNDGVYHNSFGFLKNGFNIPLVPLIPRFFPDARKYMADDPGNIPDSYLQQNIFNKELMIELSTGKSFIKGANHMREGIVIRPAIERTDPVLGRVILKLVSSEFLRKGK